MEEKRNNALEKAESIADKSKERSNDKGSIDHRERREYSQKAPSARERIKREKMREKRIRNEEKQNLKAEREKARAERRVELARIKAHKKAEREKRKATALREKNRRIAEIKAHKQQLKAEKEARREMLKNESKKERARRIQMEKQARRDERAAQRKAEAERRRQILADKRAKREERNRNREKRRESRRGYGGWLAAVISLGLATLVLASVLTFTFLMPTANDTLLEATYQKSFYDTVEQVDNIDLNLSKILASGDTGAMQKYLVDTAINSELAENDIQQLPLQDESKFYTTKLINQIGDYAKYLNNKLIQGEELTSADIEGLNGLYKANRTLKESLQKTMGKMGVDYSFSSLIEGGSGDIIISDFNELQNLSVQYPELIYDGPFSDGQSNREIKGLSGDVITAEQAKEEFTRLFGAFGLENVKNVGEVSGDIEAFNVQGEKEGEIYFAQITKTGGKLLMFSYSGSCNEVKIGDDAAIEKSQEFLTSVGINEMKPVWINLSNNLYTINFAYSVGDTTVYPDLVKIRVCAETGMVIGFEGKSYYTNHVQRTIERPSLSAEKAEEYLSANIEVENVRLALVPVGTKTEKLCYEFSGTFDGSTYYVYIDANTGRQVEMFKVIESTEGTLLL